MTIEQLLIYGAVAIGGWLLRHHGWFTSGIPAVKGSKTTVPAGPAPAAASTLKQEIETIVRDAVTSSVQTALADLRQATVPVPAK